METLKPSMLGTSEDRSGLAINALTGEIGIFSAGIINDDDQGWITGFRLLSHVLDCMRRNDSRQSQLQQRLLGNFIGSPV
jgi:hypothetical protein